MIDADYDEMLQSLSTEEKIGFKISLLALHLFYGVLELRMNRGKMTPVRRREGGERVAELVEFKRQCPEFEACARQYAIDDPTGQLAEYIDMAIEIIATAHRKTMN